MNEYDDVQFLLDTPEYSEAEWQERPKCNWSFPAFRSPERTLPAYTCHAEPRWRFLTTFSNASKTDSLYCHYHGIFFHAGVANWAMIDHNTKADTTVIDITTEEVCICTYGDECAAMIEYRETRRTPERVAEHREDAQRYWNT